VLSVSNAADQQQILYFLERIGPQAKPAIPALIATLSSDDREVRYQAVHALGAIGPDAQAAVPALRARLDDVNSMVRNATVGALKIIAPERNLSSAANQ
jgi:HEAT repeat protein